MPNLVKSRWEHGSEFHWLTFKADDKRTIHPWSGPVSFYRSGRDALKSLMWFGMEMRGWKRIWIPSYFCYDVVRSIASTDIEICIYYDSMMEDSLRLPLKKVNSGDVILIVNYFGLRGKKNFQIDISKNVEIIEDHTHDPWSQWANSSQAEFCIASLRKSLPLSDGAVLWSPKKAAIPAQPSLARESKYSTATKLEAMLLKMLYLQGYPIGKEKFREYAKNGEDDIGTGEISGMSEISKGLINCFPLFSWRMKKRKNFRFFIELIKDISWCHVLKPKDDSCCPFSVILLIDTVRRCQKFQLELIKNNIYPAVLWSLQKMVEEFEIPDEHLELSQKLLSLHCDMRYGIEDMKRVAETIIRFEF